MSVFPTRRRQSLERTEEERRHALANEVRFLCLDVPLMHG
jgi:hypothetical protein